MHHVCHIQLITIVYIWTVHIYMVNNIKKTYGYHMVLEQFILISVITTIIFISLCNISLCCWVREPNQIKMAWVVDHLLYRHDIQDLRSQHLQGLVSDDNWGTRDSWPPVAVPWVPWLKNHIMVYRRQSIRLGLKFLNTSSLGVWGISHPRQVPSNLTHLHFPESTVPIMVTLWSSSFVRTPGASGLMSI